MPSRVKETQSPPVWRNRIVSHGSVDPSTLLPSPWNWRQHPSAQQDAMAGTLRELGWIQQLVVNQRTGHLVDGHLRLAMALDAHEPMVPVLYVDLSEAEEKQALVSLDPLSAMAEADREKLAALLQEVQSGEAAVQQMLSALAVQEGIVPAGAVAVQDVEPQMDRAEELRQQWGVELGQLWQGGSVVRCPNCGGLNDME